MKKNLFSVISIAVMLILFLVGCPQAEIQTVTTTSGGGDGTTTTTIKSSSLSIMPSAVFSTAPSYNATSNQQSLSIVEKLRNDIGLSRADAQSLTKEKLTQLFMPMFTGFRTAVEGEGSGTTTKSGDMGTFIGIPVYIKVTDLSGDGKKFKFEYYWDDSIVLQDTQIGFVNIDITKPTSQKWTMYEEIKNPLNPTEKFVMNGTGYFGDEFMLGDGSFNATSGLYNISAKISWSMINSKRIINVRDGSIAYTGDKTKLASTDEVSEVSNYSSTVISDETGASVTEGSTITNTTTTGVKVVQQTAVTKSDTKGKFQEAVYTGTEIQKDSTGKITATKPIKVEKKDENGDGTFEDNTNIDTTTIQQTIDSATTAGTTKVISEGYLTIKAGFCPTQAVGKKLKIYVLKADQMDGEQPKAGLTTSSVTTLDATISSSGDASVTSSTKLAAGFYTIAAMIDMTNNDSIDNLATFDDDYGVILFGVNINGDVTVKAGDPSVGFTWRKMGSTDEVYNDGYTGTDFQKPQTLQALLTFKDADTGVSFNANGMKVYVFLNEKTSMGIIENPDAGGMADLTVDTASLSTPLKIKVPAKVFLKEITNYMVKAFIDMDQNGILSNGDYGYDDSFMNNGVSSFNFKNLALTVLKWKKLTDTEVNQQQGIDYTIFKPYDGMTPETLNGVANPNYELGTEITGTIDAAADLTNANIWFAILMPLASKEEGLKTMPIAIFKIDNAVKTYTFKNFKKNNAAPYMIVLNGLKYDDPVNANPRPLNMDDLLGLKKQSTGTGSSPLYFYANTDGKFYKGTYDSLTGLLVPSTELTASDKTIDTLISMADMSKPSESQLSSDGTVKIFVHIKYEKSGIPLADVTDINALSTDKDKIFVKVHNPDGSFITEANGFRKDLVDNTLYFEKAIQGNSYKFYASQYVEYQGSMGNVNGIISQEINVAIGSDDPSSTNPMFTFDSTKNEQHIFIYLKPDMVISDGITNQLPNVGQPDAFDIKGTITMDTGLTKYDTPFIVTVWSNDKPYDYENGAQMLARYESTGNTFEFIGGKKGAPHFIAVSNTKIYKWDGKPDEGDFFMLLPNVTDPDANSNIKTLDVTLGSSYTPIVNKYNLKLQLTNLPNKFQYMDKNLFVWLSRPDSTADFRIKNIKTPNQPQDPNTPLATIDVTFDGINEGDYVVRAFIDQDGSADIDGTLVSTMELWNNKDMRGLVPTYGDMATETYINLGGMAPGSEMVWSLNYWNFIGYEFGIKFDTSVLTDFTIDPTNNQSNYHMVVRITNTDTNQEVIYPPEDGVRDFMIGKDGIMDMFDSVSDKPIPAGSYKMTVIIDKVDPVTGKNNRQIDAGEYYAEVDTYVDEFDPTNPFYGFFAPQTYFIKK